MGMRKRNKIERCDQQRFIQRVKKKLRLPPTMSPLSGTYRYGTCERNDLSIKKHCRSFVKSSWPRTGQMCQAIHQSVLLYPSAWCEFIRIDARNMSSLGVRYVVTSRLGKVDHGAIVGYEPRDARFVAGFAPQKNQVHCTLRWRAHAEGEDCHAEFRQRNDGDDIATATLWDKMVKKSL